MKARRNPLLAILLCVGLPLIAQGSSTRGTWVSSLKQIAEAIWYYHDTYKTFPTDIVDTQGKPLLSWRVRLLPFIERAHLYEEFKLDEPWDSPHNRELISKIPHTYLNPYYADAETVKLGKANVVAPRGPKTFFGIGRPRKVEEIRNPMAVMVMGVDLEHAPIWTEPEDLRFDPADPEKGLGRWKDVVLANKEVRSIRTGSNSKLLEALFSIEESEPIPLELSWYDVINHDSVGGLIKGCFLLSLVYVLAGLVVGLRLMLRKPTSPGEMFFLIIGVQQLVLILAFVVCYRYEILPRSYGGNENQREFWAFPGLAGAFAAIVPVFWFRGSRTWRIFFTVPLIWLAILALDSWSKHQDFSAVEALATIGHPIFMALLAGAMAIISPLLPTTEVIGTRTRWHWAGIVAAVVPLIWFSICWSQGLAVPRDLFVRIRE
jgi:hypothetical protein